MMLRCSLTHRLYAAICFVLGCVAFFAFPMHRVLTNEKADNPANCPFYITLQSILVNYPLLAYDKSNAQYIKNRLIKFEADSMSNGKFASVVSQYHNNYLLILKDYGVNTISKINKDNVIIDIAKKSTSIVDGYYLDNRLYCHNPLYFSDDHHSRRILKYNFAGIYDHLPHKYMRTLAAMPFDAQLGVFSGVFANNATTTLTTQFITGFPLLTALYVLPEHDYAQIGSYSAVVPWNYFSPNILMSPRTRKAMDVAGIDVFTLPKTATKIGELLAIPDVTKINSSIYPLFSNEVTSYINLRSYGMAYLANHIIYKDPAIIKYYEDAIKNYFANIHNRDPGKFKAVTGSLYEMLMNLHDRRDIILEKNKPKKSKIIDNTHDPAGTVDVEGIVGQRALFTLNCLRSECTLVVNISDAPGWNAFVNGKPVKIERANFAFMSVVVPSGVSSVWFVYSPYSETISYFVSMLTLIAVFIFTRRRRSYAS